METTTTTNALQDLRVATAEHHKSVEKCMPLFKPGFAIPEYTALLAKFYGFHKALESKLAPICRDIPELQWDLRQRTAAIQKDLQSLDASLDVNTLKTPLELPACTTSAQALGVMYVLEGSTLGGQVITGHLKEKGFPLDAINYFGGYAEKTGLMWKQFQKVLNERVTTPHDRKEAVQAAQGTFQSLENWLSN